MTRGIHGDVQSAIDGRTVRPRSFAEFEFAGGTVRVWSGVGQTTLLGETYSGVGLLGRIGPVTESAELRANGVVFELSGLDPATAALALGEDYQGRAARLRYALVDADGAVIGDPVLIFAGRMDTMPLELGGETATIQVTAESALAELRRANGRLYTAGDQKRNYPDDKGLDYVEKIQDLEFIWGGGNINPFKSAVKRAGRR